MSKTLKTAALAVALLAAPVARAQVLPQFDLERLSLDPSAVSSMVIGTGEILPAGQGRLSLAAHYENRPLVLLSNGQVVGRGAPYDGTKLGDIVGARVTTHLGAAVSFTDRFELNLRVPIVAWQDGTKGLPGLGRLVTSGLGSPSAGFRVKLMDQSTEAVNTALGLELIAPWGVDAAVSGGSQWLFQPHFEIGRRFEKVVIGAQAGGLIREHEIAFNGHRLASEAQGGVVVATTGRLRGELSFRGGWADYDNAKSSELLAGVRLAAADFEFFALGGPGFGNTPGTPTYRGLVGVAYAPSPRKAPVAAPAPAPVDPCAPGQKHTPDQCPLLDDDGDGIKNADDACPTVPGIPEEKGCPAKDTDGDGIPDHLDKCPTVAGLAELNGCPAVDTDGDGIPDHLDKCPTVPGVAENDGCPPAKAKVNLATKKIEILEMVYFDISKATIQGRSFPLLDEVAGVLAGNPAIGKVLVEGHTDDTGAADFNTWLSDERAKAVKAYLVQKGIDAGRLDAKGFGPSQPIADNKTKEGREKNRRVEFSIQ